MGQTSTMITIDIGGCYTVVKRYDLQSDPRSIKKTFHQAGHVAKMSFLKYWFAGARDNLDSTVKPSIMGKTSMILDQE